MDDIVKEEIYNYFNNLNKTINLNKLIEYKLKQYHFTITYDINGEKSEQDINLNFENPDVEDPDYDKFNALEIYDDWKKYIGEDLNGEKLVSVSEISIIDKMNFRISRRDTAEFFYSSSYNLK